MAKISARGATKVAQANKQWTDEDGWDHKMIYTLRSDGAVLRKHSLRSPQMRESYGSRGWNEGGYSIIGKLAPVGDRSSLDRFRDFVKRNGLEMK